jgi:hypothetical protein
MLAMPGTVILIDQMLCMTCCEHALALRACHACKSAAKPWADAGLTHDLAMSRLSGYVRASA